jgi:hypothetical protein
MSSHEQGFPSVFLFFLLLLFSSSSAHSGTSQLYFSNVFTARETIESCDILFDYEHPPNADIAFRQNALKALGEHEQNTKRFLSMISENEGDASIKSQVIPIVAQSYKTILSTYKKLLRYQTQMVNKTGRIDPKNKTLLKSDLDTFRELTIQICDLLEQNGLNSQEFSADRASAETLLSEFYGQTDNR